jgi:hypothetical protein
MPALRHAGGYSDLIHGYTYPLCGWQTAGKFPDAFEQLSRHVIRTHPPQFACPTCKGRNFDLSSFSSEGERHSTCIDCAAADNDDELLNSLEFEVDEDADG